MGQYDGAAAGLSAPVRDLAAAVDALAGQSVADLPGGQAMADATALLRELERLRAVVLTRIADVGRRTLHTLADAPSTGTWVATQQTCLTRTEVALARRLAAFPTVAAAVDSGSLSVAVAARGAAALVKARPHVDRPDGLVDGQPAEPTLRAVVVDGVLSLVCQARGGLDDRDPLVRDLHAALVAIADQPVSELDRLTEAFVLLASSLEPGDLPHALGQLLDALLPNELERRAQDAFEQRGLRMRLKEDGSGWLVTRGELDLEWDKAAPHVSVTVPLGALHDSPGALPPVAASGARLPRSPVRQWWCDSAVTRFVLGLGHRVIEMSHTERTLKPHERRAKRVETGGRCQGAGCRCGAGRRLVPQHADPWATSGRTSLAETVLLCEQTHHELHSGRAILLKDGRRLGPHGWIRTRSHDGHLTAVRSRARAPARRARPGP